MIELNIHYPGGPCPVLIGRLPESLTRVKSILTSESGCIVSDRNVYSIYGEAVAQALESRSACLVPPFLFPPGERSKRLSMLERCLRHLARQRINRNGCVFALGGGVTGDLAGFAAAVYMRGVRIVQIPTSLIAQGDASIGGKTGVNLPEGKNLAGSFHQPSAVVIDPGFLKTLNLRHLKNGLAEIVKSAVIGDETLFDLLEHETDIFRKMHDESFAAGILKLAVSVKSRIVGMDEKERGLRAILNFGHTIGHALEAASSYSRMLHGEAVSIGMAAESWIAARIGILHPRHQLRIVALLESLGMPVDIRSRNLNLRQVADHMFSDKKTDRSGLRFSLPESIGTVSITENIPFSLIEESLLQIGCRLPPKNQSDPLIP